MNNNSTIAGPKPGWERGGGTLTATWHDISTDTQSTAWTLHKTLERKISGLAAPRQDEWRRECGVWTNFQIDNWMIDNGVL